MDAPTALPTGFTMSPKDTYGSRAAGSSGGTRNVVHFNELAAGGHFTALEQPEGFVADVRATFAQLT